MWRWESPLSPSKTYDKPIRDPSLTVKASASIYLSNALRTYLPTKAGFKGTIKLKEQADILFIYKSQWRNFWWVICSTKGLKYSSKEAIKIATFKYAFFWGPKVK